MSDLYLDAGPVSSERKVMLATTAYDSPSASYVFSIAQSRGALEKAGIASAYLLLSGNCHVDDARNAVVRDFLASDCESLVFLDADVSWQPEDLVRLCQYDLDMVGGVYPYRRPDEHGAMPFRPLLDGMIPHEGLLEVQGLPTGFLRIRRAVFDALMGDVRSYSDGGRTTWLFFERTLEDGRRWGGDLRFCKRWRDAGGKLYAASEMRLGHVAKVTVTDSLGAHFRRISGSTLRHVVRLIREGRELPGSYQEAFESVGNNWGAPSNVLATAVALARNADGPIIETGSGLSTVLMAAATGQTVFCIEHDPQWAASLERMAQDAGVGNIGICVAPLVDGWYDLRDFGDLPGHFSLGVNDGPPRMLGDRMAFLNVFGDRCRTILCDDADEDGYAAKIDAWAKARERSTARPELRTMLVLA